MGEICDYDHLVLDGSLEAVDGGMGLLILQLNLAGIETLSSCSGHGEGYPSVLCSPGMQKKLKEFGCNIVVTTEDGRVEGFFLSNMCGGKLYPASVKKCCYICQGYKFPRRKSGELDYTLITICKEHKEEALHNMIIDYWDSKRMEDKT